MMILLLAFLTALQENPLEAVRGWDAHQGRVHALAFDESGETLTSAGAGGIRTWKVQDGSRRSAVAASGDAFAFSPDGRWVAVSDKGKDTHDPTPVRILDSFDGKQKRALPGPIHGVYAIEFSPDGTRVAVGGLSHLCLYDLGTGKRLFEIDGHSYGTTSIAWSADGTLIAARSPDEKMRLVRTDGREERVLSSESSMNAVGISKDGTVAAEGSDSRILCWDLKTGRKTASISTKEAHTHRLVFSPDGAWLAVVQASSRLVLLETRTWRPTVETHRAPLRAAAWSRDGRWLATGDLGGRIILWKVR